VTQIKKLKNIPNPGAPKVSKRYRKEMHKASVKARQEEEARRQEEARRDGRSRERRVSDAEMRAINEEAKKEENDFDSLSTKFENLTFAPSFEAIEANRLEFLSADRKFEPRSGVEDEEVDMSEEENPEEEAGSS